MERQIKSADHLMRTAVDETVHALGLDDKDVAAVRLAQFYADSIDGANGAKEIAWVLRWIGPLLLDCLSELGATPGARKNLKEKPVTHGVSQLDKLRAARAIRSA